MPILISRTAREVLYAASFLLMVLYVLEKWRPGMVLMQMRLGWVFLVMLTSLLIVIASATKQSHVEIAASLHSSR